MEKESTKKKPKKLVKAVGGKRKGNTQPGLGVRIMKMKRDKAYLKIDSALEGQKRGGTGRGEPEKKKREGGSRTLTCG